MPRTAKHLSDMEFDEISFVDRPANQHARIAIAKRAPEEGAVDDYFDETGAVVDLATLEPGSVVFDDEGNGYEWTVEEDQGTVLDSSEGVTKSLSESVRESLSKALTDVDRDDAISKAFEEVSKAEERANAAEAIAKAERDLRLTREYTEVAKNYGVPVPADELGPVLMRAAESMSYEDCAVIHKALSSAGAAFDEIGTRGQGNGPDPLSDLDLFDEEDLQEIGKAAGAGTTREQAISKAFENNPQAYDDYLASRRG